MKSLIVAAALALAVPGAASAVTFSGNWGVSGSGLSDPGLVVRASPPGGFSFDIASGASASFNLFRIWSPEGAVGSDDLVPRGLRVGFNLTSHDASGAISGTTAGHRFLGLQWGSVDWSAPLRLDVGTGVLSVELEDTGFNAGFLSLAQGEPWGSDVRATFSYTSPVPLPAGFGLIAAGMAALGLLGFRRRTA